VNHTRFPKEDYLPYWARRDNEVTKGDRVGRVLRNFYLPVCYSTQSRTLEYWFLNYKVLLYKSVLKTNQHQSRTPYTPHQTLCPVIIWNSSLVRYYISEIEVLASAHWADCVCQQYNESLQQRVPTRFHTECVSVLYREIKALPKFQNYIHERSIQFNYNFRFKKQTQRNTKSWDCNNTCINMRKVFF